MGVGEAREGCVVTRSSGRPDDSIRKGCEQEIRAAISRGLPQGYLPLRGKGT